MTQPPRPGYTTMALCNRVIDGDTIEVSVIKTIRVRLLDCWAPEIHLDPRVPEDKRVEKKQRGFESKSNLEALVDGKEVIIEVPTSADGIASEATTMGRVLGHVYLPHDPQSVNAKQVEAGFATSKKPEELRR